MSSLCARVGPARHIPEHQPLAGVSQGYQSDSRSSLHEGCWSCCSSAWVMGEAGEAGSVLQGGIFMSLCGERAAIPPGWEDSLQG